MKSKNALFCIASGSVTLEVIEFAISLSDWGFTIYGNEVFVRAIGRLNECISVYATGEMEKSDEISIVVADCDDLSCAEETKKYCEDGVFIVPTELLKGNSFFKQLLITIAIGDESEMVETEELIDAPVSVMDLLKQLKLNVSDVVDKRVKYLPLLAQCDSDRTISAKNLDNSLTAVSNLPDLNNHFLRKLKTGLKTSGHGALQFRLLREWEAGLGDSNAS